MVVAPVGRVRRRLRAGPRGRLRDLLPGGPRQPGPGGLALPRHPALAVDRGPAGRARRHPGERRRLLDGGGRHRRRLRRLLRGQRRRPRPARRRRALRRRHGGVAADPRGPARRPTALAGAPRRGLAPAARGRRRQRRPHLRQVLRRRRCRARTLRHGQPGLVRDDRPGARRDHRSVRPRPVAEGGRGGLHRRRPGGDGRQCPPADGGGQPRPGRCHSPLPEHQVPPAQRRRIRVGRRRDRHGRDRGGAGAAARAAAVRAPARGLRALPDSGRAHVRHGETRTQDRGRQCGHVHAARGRPRQHRRLRPDGARAPGGCRDGARRAHVGDAVHRYDGRAHGAPARAAHAHAGRTDGLGAHERRGGSGCEPRRARGGGAVRGRHGPEGGGGRPVRPGDARRRDRACPTAGPCTSAWTPPCSGYAATPGW